jgi:poly-beta-1,6-N-acetyl-D-glucosamine synthase
MTSLAIITFWCCAALLVYAHAGYPALLWVWCRLWPRAAGEQTARAQLPLVTVIVVAQDEAERITARIENLLAQDYPPERVNLEIASDGSADATAARARAFEGERLEVFDFPERRGKPAVLNDLVPGARGEIVVLADARQRFDPGALRALVAPFADPAVGAVSGELVLDAGPLAGAAAGAGLYWTYEKFLRRCESRIDSTLGATGAIYAIRRTLFDLIRPDTVLDDVLIPCRVVRQGYRVVFEPRAVAHDRPADPAAEFQRKVRTLSGNFQLFARERWLLDLRRNRLWLQTVSHKLLRLACPLLLFGALVSSALLARQPLFAAALGCQLCFYAAALAGLALVHSGRRPRLFAVPYLFCLLHLATAAGFLRFARGRANATWRTPGSTPALPSRLPSARPARLS